MTGASVSDLTESRPVYNTRRNLLSWWTPIVLTLAFMTALYLRTQTFFEPWIGSHNAWGGAMYGNIAENYLRYGYRTTLLGPITNTGHATPEQFEFYYHHPPLLVWLISLSYRIFGIHEWSARLVPLSFSLLLMLLVYAFAKRAWSAQVGVLAVVFLAVMPIESYYATHVDIYGSQAVFFTFLSAYGYYTWLEGSRTKGLLLCCIGVLLGCLTSWLTYFIIPLFLLHFHFVHSRRIGRPALRPNPLWWIAVIAASVFVFFLVHRYLLLSDGRPELYEDLLSRFQKRISADIGDGRGMLAVLTLHVRHIVHLYSKPLAAGVAVWVMMFAWMWRQNRVAPADWVVFILLGYGFLHTLIFPSATYSHEFLVVSYAPGVAVAAATALTRFARVLENRMSAKVAVCFLLVCVLAVVSLAFVKTQSLYAADNRSHGQNLLKWRQVIAQISHPTDVLVSPVREDRIFQYYAGRRVIFDAVTPEKVVKAGEGLNRYFVVLPEELASQHKDLLLYLQKRHPGRLESGLYAFSIGAHVER